MDFDKEYNIMEAKKPESPPIVIDFSVGFLDKIKRFSKECTYKRTSIGTKIFLTKSCDVSLNIFLKSPQAKLFQT